MLRGSRGGGLEKDSSRCWGIRTGGLKLFFCRRLGVGSCFTGFFRFRVGFLSLVLLGEFFDFDGFIGRFIVVLIC